MIEIDSAIALTLDSLYPEAAVLDASGDILFVNRRWKEFALANGMRAPDSGLGQNYLWYCDQDNSRYREYSQQIAVGLRAVIAGTRPEFYIEYPCPSPRGEQWFALRFNPLQNAKDTPLFLMVHDEITAKVISMRHLKETNEILRESRDRAEAASHYKSKFVATLSHEIRTPLNAILGLTDILHGEIEQSEHRQYLEHVQNAGSILLNLLNDILDLTRLEQGKLQLQSTPFSVRHSILNSVLAYRYLVERKGLQFNVHIHDRLPDMLYGDAFRLNQILSNLISNALKFTREGEVKIEMDAKIGEQDDDDVIELIGRVSDTGPGIPENQQKRIFESFMQLDESVASNFGGSGLGLNVVRELLELMGGSIRLISPTPDGTPENPGTCMEFHIPFRKGSEQHNGNQPEFNVQFPQIQARVLIGEDNPVNQLILTKYLEKADCQVTAFSNGKEVLAHALENHANFDLICLDLRMPDMDGHEIVRELRMRDIHIPVIAITADAFNDSMNRSEQVGMNAHLVKPLEASQLYSRMLHLLKKPQAG